MPLPPIVEAGFAALARALAPVAARAAGAAAAQIASEVKDLARGVGDKAEAEEMRFRGAVVSSRPPRRKKKPKPEILDAEIIEDDS